ncbi:MAG: cobalamin-binding protein [Bacteroidetes bacterium]|nr:cobalamin-binding protein [Bacteroidota bacterium]
MENILERIAYCIEFGKINKVSPYPPDMKGQDGVDELTKLALEQGISPNDILNKGFVYGMDKVGKKFSENKVFVPQMLISAKAMSTGMMHLKPFFTSGEVKRKGKFVIGTVAGDLHDIGKNLVSMMVEGSGWEVIDLGVDVNSQKFIENIKNTNASAVALSALLTTTMVNMEKIVQDIRLQVPNIKICVGGAPVNQDFCTKIGADHYSPDPQGVVEYLNKLVA